MNENIQICINNLVNGNDVNNSAGYLREQFANQAAEIERLKKFAKNFLANFETCPNCENGDDQGQTCFTCQGTGKRISSLGYLYVELPEEARGLLK